MAATPVSTIQGEIAGLEGDLMTLGGAGIAIGAAVFALRKGWSTLKSFVR